MLAPQRIKIINKIIHTTHELILSPFLGVHVSGDATCCTLSYGQQTKAWARVSFHLGLCLTINSFGNCYHSQWSTTAYNLRMEISLLLPPWSSSVVNPTAITQCATPLTYHCSYKYEALNSGKENRCFFGGRASKTTEPLKISLSI